MLQRLSLRDFVIVDELELDLHAGFTALTGETGAGKSILIDALQLTLGSRGDAGVVREGAAKAEITAEFDLPEALATRLGMDPATLRMSVERLNAHAAAGQDPDFHRGETDYQRNMGDATRGLVRPDAQTPYATAK